MAQEDPAKDLKDTLQEMCYQLQEDLVPHEVTEDFILEAFLRDFVSAVKKVDINSRKIGLAFAELPFPSPSSVFYLMTCMKDACVKVLVVFAKLPRCKGRTLRKEVADYLLLLYNAVKGVASSVSQQRGFCLQAAIKLCWICDDVIDISKGKSISCCCYKELLSS
ncbi:uncharacterized protein LOC119435117 isoform X2 [Dermacentor silvarum]|uniref:uncharacterized protein LOC119435117 isoform X2 n=2 Tax=Dermacentor silvarum TaxID=543639 RepID=UPI00189A0F4B|nr:uncharacterized protein LOC119435117 isoform X2 [Dermacentor silvarum]